MKHTVIGTLVLGFGFALPAWPQTPKEMSPSKMKCEDFVAVDVAYQPTLVYWVAGVDHLGISETDTMVVDTATPIAAVAALRHVPRLLRSDPVVASIASDHLIAPKGRVPPPCFQVWLS